MIVITHYNSLKVTEDAPIEVIRAAYKALAQIYHPDLNPTNTAAAEKMQVINEAYKVLSNPQKRLEHDAWIRQQGRQKSEEVTGGKPAQATAAAPENKAVTEAATWAAWADKALLEAKEARDRADKAIAKAAEAKPSEKAMWTAWADKAKQEAREAQERADKAVAKAAEAKEKVQKTSK